MTDPLDIEVGDATLVGDLTVPSDARGVVVFVHGSGSSRHSPRNQAVARSLQDRRLATLLFDLLRPDEEEDDARTRRYRFDVELLTSRLTQVIDQVVAWEQVRSLPVGLFGASTGAAVALVAAGRRPDAVHAIVSRGGRPDLAGDALGRVRAATLLVVGERDEHVLDLNDKAAASLATVHELRTVTGATHLFEESGALEQVADWAGEWFARYLVQPEPEE